MLHLVFALRFHSLQPLWSFDNVYKIEMIEEKPNSWEGQSKREGTEKH